MVQIYQIIRAFRTFIISYSIKFISINNSRLTYLIFIKPCLDLLTDIQDTLVVNPSVYITYYYYL